MVDIAISDDIFKTYKNNPITPLLEEAITQNNLADIARYATSLASTISGDVPQF